MPSFEWEIRILLFGQALRILSVFNGQGGFDFLPIRATDPVEQINHRSAADGPFMSMQSSIFATLPGLEVPVADISTTLSQIWEVPSSDLAVRPSEFRATQMNLIIHFGLGTESGEAVEVFETALRFAQRYPSRIIVLCPEDRSREETLLTSKLFSECYIGKSGRDRSCCEAIILAYPAEGRNFLENQVSILLETDLPTYYWQHRFQAAHRLTDYRFFLEVSRRIVYDSRREGAEVREIAWPRPEMVRDLACASLLPVRQAVGQFLSGFDPRDLVRGLTGVRLCRSRAAQAEAIILLDWVREALRACAKVSDCELEATFECCQSEQSEGYALEIHFDYDDGRFFRWTAHRESKIAEIDADLGRGKVHLPTALKSFKPEAALAEALFF